MSKSIAGRRLLALLVPNALTALRGVAGVLIGLYWQAPISWGTFWLILSIELTDLLDGFTARWLGATSRFGALADPFADKAFNLGVGWITYSARLLPAWYFPWLTATYLATALLYLLHLVVRRPPRGQRVPRPHPLGRAAGFVTALAVLTAIVPLRSASQFAVYLAYLSIAATVLHLLLTGRRLLYRRQEFYTGTL